MAKDPAFLFYPGDYLRDTQCLSEKSQVAYDRIMCEHMRNICITYEQLNFFTKRLSEEEKKEVLMLLRKTKDGYQIEWVAESISKRMAYSESRRKNKQGKTKIICESYVNHMENAIVNENKDEILLGKSENLFPKITEVERVFLQQGGTKEMALAFFNRYEAVEWKIRGSTITNYPTLIGTFIINWHKNETHGSHNGSSKSNRDKQTEATGRLLNKLRGITGTGQTSASG